MIAEMGGKNAIIVDDDADLDEAVLGVVKSAFGYQGQKCSACSRAIVLGERLRRVPRAAGRSDAQPEGRPGRRSGDQRRPGDRRRVARARSSSTSSSASSEGARGAGRRRGPAGRAKAIYVGPHIFADVPPDVAAGAGRNLRPGAGRDPRRRSGRSVRASPTAPTTR